MRPTWASSGRSLLDAPDAGLGLRDRGRLRGDGEAGGRGDHRDGGPRETPRRLVVAVAAQRGNPADAAVAGGRRDERRVARGHHAVVGIEVHLLTPIVGAAGDVRPGRGEQVLFLHGLGLGPS